LSRKNLSIENPAAKLDQWKAVKVRMQAKLCEVQPGAARGGAECRSMRLSWS
jgi:hypothetical protein